MQTGFSIAQLADPGSAMAESILRKCVHCGFCLATCPTYQIRKDELDSPRGRIYLIRDMLENERVPDQKTVLHIDRCLSCLSCMTTCPSGVHYMHLVDHARGYIEKKYKRPWPERLLRHLLAFVLPRPALFRLSLYSARLARPFKNMLPGRLSGLAGMAPDVLARKSPTDRPQVFRAEGPRRMRVALMTGCAQRVLDPAINESTIRLLTRHGVEVVVAGGAGCCGALTHHMGMESRAHAAARANIRAWCREKSRNGLDHIIINTSGCGTTVKDYGHMFRDDAELTDDAEAVSAMTLDISELMSRIGLRPTGKAPKLRVAYHAACSLQHGQKVTREPPDLLRRAGYEVLAIPEGHLCCGSAGTYNLLQPELAAKLRARKLRNISSVSPDVIATGNIGCMIQIAGGTQTPVLHTVELLDLATGGPVPEKLAVGSGIAAKG